MAFSCALVACGGRQEPRSELPPPVMLAPGPEPTTVGRPQPPSATATSPEEGADATLVEKLLADWSPSSQCNDYDYYPEGGLQNLWCHRAPSLTFADLGRLAKAQVFTSGPHRVDDLDLNQAKTFGHYNPDFVRFLVENAVSAPGSLGARATQPHYEKHLRPIARIFWATRQKLDQEPACMAREQKAYEKAIGRGTAAYYERWFFFMNPAFCGPTKPDSWYYNNGMDGGVDGNVTKTVVGFWLRRSMDGSYQEFGRGLRKLLETYDPELLSQ